MNGTALRSNEYDPRNESQRLDYMRRRLDERLIGWLENGVPVYSKKTGDIRYRRELNRSEMNCVLKRVADAHQAQVSALPLQRPVEVREALLAHPDGRELYLQMSDPMIELRR